MYVTEELRRTESLWRSKATHNATHAKAAVANEVARDAPALGARAACDGDEWSRGWDR